MIYVFNFNACTEEALLKMKREKEEKLQKEKEIRENEIKENERQRELVKLKEEKLRLEKERELKRKEEKRRREAELVDSLEKIIAEPSSDPSSSNSTSSVSSVSSTSSSSSSESSSSSSSMESDSEVKPKVKKHVAVASSLKPVKKVEISKTSKDSSDSEQEQSKGKQPKENVNQKPVQEKIEKPEIKLSCCDRVPKSKSIKTIQCQSCKKNFHASAKCLKMKKTPKDLTKDFTCVDVRPCLVVNFCLLIFSVKLKQIQKMMWVPNKLSKAFLKRMRVIMNWALNQLENQLKHKSK